MVVDELGDRSLQLLLGGLAGGGLRAPPLEEAAPELRRQGLGMATRDVHVSVNPRERVGAPAPVDYAAARWPRSTSGRRTSPSSRSTRSRTRRTPTSATAAESRARSCAPAAAASRTRAIGRRRSGSARPSPRAPASCRPGG